MRLTGFRAGNRLRKAMLSRLVHALRFTSGARARAAAAILVLVLPSCSSSYPNPFENSSQMTPPPATAKIVFTANTYATQKGGGLDIFAMEDTGANVTRLTFCNTADRRSCKKHNKSDCTLQLRRSAREIGIEPPPQIVTASKIRNKR